MQKGSIWSSMGFVQTARNVLLLDLSISGTDRKYNVSRTDLKRFGHNHFLVLSNLIYVTHAVAAKTRALPLIFYSVFVPEIKCGPIPRH